MSTDQESPPAQNETISKGSSLSSNSTLTTATNKPETDPNIEEMLPPTTETTSKNTPPENTLSQTMPNKNPKTEDVEPLKHCSASDVDPQMLDKTPSENETTSKNTSPTKHDPTQTKATSERETDPTEAIQQDSATGADPHVHEITPVEYKTDDTEAHEKDFSTDAQQVTPVEKETTSKNSPPPDYIPTQTTTTHELDTDENKTLKNPSKRETDHTEAIQQDSATGADPHVHEITPDEHKTDDTEAHEKDFATDAQQVTPVEKETTSKNSPPPDYIPTQTTTTHELDTDENKTLKNPSKLDSISLWKKIKSRVLNGGKRSQPKTSQGTKNQTTDDVKESLLSRSIQADIDYMKKGAEKLEEYHGQLNSIINDASKDFTGLKEQQGKEKDFLELKKAMIKLKLQIPYKDDADEKEHHKKFQFSSKAKQSIPDEVLSIMPQLHKNSVFESSMEFKDFEVRYNDLSPKLKLCLLCFSAFPENAIIKKRLMVQWWVAEGFASENVVASKYFLKLIKKGFIEPADENKSLFLGSCRMHPFYRSALVILAERAKFFNFNAEGEPIQDFSGSFQGCLVGKGLISLEDFKKGSVQLNALGKYLEKVHLLINVNEPILEFKLDWFSQMRNVNLLYLGRWRASATDHREVEDTEFLDGLKNMNYIKFLSLQGVSNIIALPESILHLAHLKILDLRACHNLETIPDQMGLLKGLTHLDMSECYLLNHMPKSLSSLTELTVLKGFVVGSDQGKNSCTLDDLKKLRNLIKLCIHTGLREFPDGEHVRALGNLEKLSKLTITWGRTASRAAIDNGKYSNGNKKDIPTKGETRTTTQTSGLPKTLEKLDLKCFPMSKTPDWLQLNNLKDLKELKKLYIRGGKLSDLGQYQEVVDDDWNAVGQYKNKWTVKVLRLKYLSEIEMEWRQLHELFPDLVFLEQVSCPKLSLFPCDANGVWMNETKLKDFQGTVP